MAKAARSHHCHAAFQLVVRLDRHRVARHHLTHRSLLRIEPGQQHFYGAVTLGHDTDQYVVVDDQHRPDPVVAHLAQGFDDHVAGTNMDQGATLRGQIAPTNSATVMPRSLAISLKLFQNSSSRLILVLWP